MMEAQDFCLEVTKIIEKDGVAVAAWNTVKDSLVTDQVHRLRISKLFEEKKYHEAIFETMQRWDSAQTKPNWEQFVSIMREHGLVKLADELESLNLDTARTKTPIWFEVTEVPHNFTGRLIEMDTLHDLMLKSPDRNPGVFGVGQFVAVTGLGGVGKSTLCGNYAKQHKYRYQNVLLIQAETTDSMRASYQRLCTHLGIKTSQDISIEDLAKSVNEYCSSKSCLFIFDNLEDFGVLRSFLPKVNPWSAQRFTLITSRTLNIVPYNMHLDTLTEEDARSFVLAEVENSTHSDAEELAKLLDRLPLALQQAVAYIKETFGEFGTQTVIQKYIARFKTSMASLLSYKHFQEINGYVKTTYTTWTVTLVQIKVKSVSAVAILEILSFLNPDQISDKFVSKLMFENLEQALMVLEKHSMIRLDSDMIRIHRLVQQVVMLGLEETRRTALTSSIVQVIRKELNESDFTLSARESVLHGLHLAKNQHLNTMPAAYLSRLCLCLQVYGNYADSLEISSRAVEHFTSLYGANHLHTLLMNYRMGVAHLRLENNPAALAILEITEQLAITNPEIGKEHPFTLELQQAIVRVYVDTDPGNSMKMYKELIPSMERVLEKDNKNVISTMQNKAFAMMKLGKLDDARSTLEKANEMCVSAGSADNLTGLQIKACKVAALCLKEDFVNALPILKEVYQSLLFRLERLTQS